MLATTFLSACAATPAFKRPDVAAPAAFTGTQGQTPTAINAAWWQNFGSDELDQLMTEALAQNTDIRAGVHRVEQARADLKIAGANLLPSIGASAGAGRNFQNNPSAQSTNLSLGANISYELDLFGGNKAGVSAARANLAQTQYGEDALKLVVMGDVAKGYFTFVNLRERLAIADDNLKNAREVMRIVQARYDAGAVSALDVAEQKTVVSSREASRAALQSQLTQAGDALAVLLGRAPQDLSVRGSVLRDIDVPKIAAGQPSSLLERRPDIQAAEAGLVAANANIGVARAALFPQVTLGTNWSLAAAGFTNPATTALALAASLSAPIFEGGRLEGGVEKASAKQAELAEDYRKTVLTAFQEVEDAIAALRAAHEREVALGAAVTDAQRAYGLSRDQYNAGAIDFQQMLSTQDTLLSTQDSHAQTRLESLSAAIDLYKALGGGWNP
ncbi:MAG: efflux transporter outer membrane subunit [Rhodospirillales bacterium]|nr:MAG: efflux transporter outer membrane subunit [Rhodospirillales bacterium]